MRKNKLKQLSTIQKPKRTIIDYPNKGLTPELKLDMLYFRRNGRRWKILISSCAMLRAVSIMKELKEKSYVVYKETIEKGIEDKNSLLLFLNDADWDSIKAYLSPDKG